MKYGNVPTNVEGKSFHSKHEAQRYSELVLLQKAGEIENLQLQVTYRLDVGGHHICKYIADFVYDDKNGRQVVEDTKSYATAKDPVYRLKKKLMKACHGIEIHEVMNTPRKIRSRAFPKKRGA